MELIFIVRHLEFAIIWQKTEEEALECVRKIVARLDKPKNFEWQESRDPLYPAGRSLWFSFTKFKNAF